MDLYNLVISAKLSKGEGGDVSVDPLSVTENGTYTASSGHAYSPVTVSVPQSGITPTGTKDISANGVYDVTDFASASVSVPTGVFPSGTSSITSNGIYDITNFASVDVNVSGGGGGEYIFSNSYVTFYSSYAFRSCSEIIGVSLPNLATAKPSAFEGTGLRSVSLPRLNIIENFVFRSCRSLSTATFDVASAIYNGAFYGCSKLMSVYLMSKNVATLMTSGAFTGTPMLNSSLTGSFGSIYVPASLVDSYKSASEWSSYFADRITAYEGE